MRTVTFVCYTSKLCNLRCKYCYELPLLADARRMQIEQIGAMFRHVAEYYTSLDHPVRVVFQWHGGEPLLIERDFYREVFALQRATFDSTGIELYNVIQTNLTVRLTDEIVEMLRDDFDAVGVSLDLYGGLRVDAGGKDREPQAIENLERLLELGIIVEGITVLTKPNLHHIRDIFEFYRARGMGFRLLPLEKGLYGSGADFGVTAEEVRAAMCELADLWLEDGSIDVEPLRQTTEMLTFAAAHPDNRVAIYDLLRWAPILLVDTDGTLYSYSDRFRPELSPGNIFESPLADCLGSDTFQRVAARTNRRIDRACSTCPFFGRACSGSAVAQGELAFDDPLTLGSRRCVIPRGLLRHLEMRLNQAALLPHPIQRPSPKGASHDDRQHYARA